MLYDMKADAFRMLDRLEQEDRSWEVARQRLAREALAQHQKKCTNRIPGLVDRVRKLANREPDITPKPAS